MFNSLLSISLYLNLLVSCQMNNFCYIYILIEFIYFCFMYKNIYFFLFYVYYIFCFFGCPSPRACGLPPGRGLLDVTTRFEFIRLILYKAFTHKILYTKYYAR